MPFVVANFSNTRIEAREQIFASVLQSSLSDLKSSLESITLEIERNEYDSIVLSLPAKIEGVFTLRDKIVSVTTLGKVLQIINATQPVSVTGAEFNLFLASLRAVIDNIKTLNTTLRFGLTARGSLRVVGNLSSNQQTSLIDTIASTLDYIV